MVKIAFSSDNHLDLNRQDFLETLKQQTEYLIKNNYQYYFFAGDLSNDFEKTIKFFEEMNIYAGGFLKPYFIAGNHDMGKGISFAELEHLKHPQYLHKQKIKIQEKSIFGLNGWYDYSFVDGDYPVAEITQFKNGLWFDRVIDNDGLSDIQRYQKQIESLQPAEILVTHFLPNNHQIKRFKDNKRFDLSNAMMGGEEISKESLELGFENIIYGHMHMNAEYVVENTQFNNVSVGSKNELKGIDFLDVWKNKLLTLDI